MNPISPDAQAPPLVLINTFTPKPGCVDEFVAMQIATTAQLGDAARALGWLGNRIYRSNDGTEVVILTAFTSAQAQAAWARHPLFIDHRKAIAPLLALGVSRPCTLAAAHGAIDAA